MAHTLKAGSEDTRNILLQRFDPRSSDASDSAAGMIQHDQKMSVGPICLPRVTEDSQNSLRLTENKKYSTLGLLVVAQSVPILGSNEIFLPFQTTTIQFTHFNCVFGDSV